ncbi:MAG TPA: type I-A CRISPR-associated protein Cas5 [Bacillus bacterium]|nr:type I-A CRISPR-associated protein Cas5 [Bacillus sp. (in: firmicutes)]
MKWLIAEYTFTSPFSLKSSLATSSGGKTNLLPTMFAFKMALINVAYHIGLDGEVEFKWIKELDIRFKPPKKATVQNAFVKILKESRKEVLTEDPSQVFTSSVALREYVLFNGSLYVAINIEKLENDNVQKLKQLLIHINQLGKRGCFVQFLDVKDSMLLDDTFTFFLEDKKINMPKSLMIQHLDDMGKKAKFESINSYSSKSVTLGKDRIFRQVGVPYKLIKSSRGFSHYERID